jgi:alpha-tubulin suppressor-like RCC1 family protein
LGLGAAHTCAASTDGRLRCWGANDYGQLGDGTTVTPVTGTAAVPLGR